MTNLVKFGTVDPEAEDAQYDEMGSKEWLRFDEGITVIRIAPPMLGEKLALRRVAKHYIQLPGQQKKVVFNCPKFMARSHCYGCDMVERLQATGNPVDQQLAQDYRANEGLIGLAVDRAHPERGLQKVQFSKAMMDRLREMEDISGRPRGLYADAVKGYDIRVLRTGKKFETKWTMRETAPGPLGTPEQIEEWVATKPSLTRDLRVQSDDEIAQMLGMRPQADAGRRASRTAQDDVKDIEGEEV